MNNCFSCFDAKYHIWLIYLLGYVVILTFKIFNDVKCNNHQGLLSCQLQPAQTHISSDVQQFNHIYILNILRAKRSCLYSKNQRNIKHILYIGWYCNTEKYRVFLQCLCCMDDTSIRLVTVQTAATVTVPSVIKVLVDLFQGHFKMAHYPAPMTRDSKGTQEFLNEKKVERVCFHSTQTPTENSYF